MVANAPKRYEMHQNMSLRSNGVDRVLSLRKISMRLRGMKYCTSSARFAPSFVRQPNGPKCNQIVRNSPKHEIKVQWGGLNMSLRSNAVDRVLSLQKISMRLRGMKYCTSS